MGTDVRFDELRKRTYLEYHEDGLIDILVGAGALGFGLSMLVPESSLWLLTAVVAFFYVPLKNRITVPRVGYVRFGARHGPDPHRFLTILTTFSLVAGLFVALLASGIVPQASTWLYQYFPLVLGGLGAAGFAAVAAVLGVQRYYLYAVLAMALSAGAAAGAWSLAAAMIALAGALLSVGVVLLARFVRRNPVSVLESNGDL